MPERRDATANLTLAEIRARDIDNLDLVYNASRKRFFDKKNQAFAFMGKCVNAALLKFGIDQLKTDAIVRNTPFLAKNYQTILEEKINKAMKEKDVKVERRRYEEPGEAYKSGVYIYHGNEIAYFISEIMRVEKKQTGISIILPYKTQYLVVSNAPA